MILDWRANNSTGSFGALHKGVRIVDKQFDSRAGRSRLHGAFLRQVVGVDLDVERSSVDFEASDTAEIP